MIKYIDMKGERYGRLTVESFSHKNKHNTAVWNCRCDCGKSKIATRSHLMAGDVKSCGCLKKEIEHGQSKTKLYSVWASMLDRCRNKNRKDYKYYGGKGVQVCGEWEDFLEFYERSIASGYEQGLTIERIDGDGNYEPSNCEWIPFSEQHKNKSYKMPSSGFRNVSWHEASGMWYVRVFKESKLIYSKLFENFEDACSASERVNIKYKGEYKND